MTEISPKDELHELVRGLNPAEKRLFKMDLGSSAGRKARNYLLLFDALGEMDEYSPAGLDQALQGAIPASSLTSARSRLFGHIVRNLSRRQDQQSPEGRLRTEIADIELLLGRGLPKAARKRIRTAKALARQYELDLYLHALLDLEQRQVMAFEVQAQDEALCLIEAERQSCLRDLDTTARLRTLHERLRALSQSNTQARREAPEPQSRFETVLNDPAVLAPPPAQSLIAGSFHQNIWGIHHLRKGAFTDAHLIYSRLMQAWRARPEMIPAYPSLYLGIVNNYLSSALFASQRKSDFLKSLAPLKEVRNLSEQDMVKLQRISYYHELNYHLNYGSYASGMVFIGKLNRWLSRHGPQLQPNRLLVFEFSMASFFFAYGEFSRALRHIRNIINFPPGHSRKEIGDFARIMQLMVHHELGTHDLKESMLRSAYRYFKRGQKLYAYERALIRYFHRVENPVPQEPRLSAERELEHRLAEIREQEGEHPVGLPLISIWLESKIRGLHIRKYFEEVVRQNHAVRED